MLIEVKDGEQFIPKGVPYYLSIGDLIKTEGFQEAYGNNNRLAIENILFKNGLDTNQPYVLSEDPPCHRLLTSKELFCGPRYYGSLRSDSYWKKNYASVQELILMEEDTDLKIELLRMSKEGFSSNTEEDEE